MLFLLMLDRTSSLRNLRVNLGIDTKGQASDGAYTLLNILFHLLFGLALDFFLASGVLGLLYSLISKEFGVAFTIDAWYAGTTPLSVAYLQVDSRKTARRR